MVLWLFFGVCVCVCFRVSADTTIHHRALHRVIIPVVPVLGGCQSERGNNKRPRDGPIFGAY